jgi:inner membrane protein
MLLFGHLGTTLAFTGLIEKVTDKINKDNEFLAIDYRLIMIGSMLPDIIDKPLVLMISDKTVGSARFAAHSLMFTLILLTAGLFSLIWHRKQGIILIAFSSMAHITEDLIWRNPKVFFWPYYSIILNKMKISQPAMQRMDIDNRIEIIAKSISKLDMKKILLEPDVLIPEIAGGLIIIYFIVKLLLNKNLIRFIKTGLIK